MSSARTNVNDLRGRIHEIIYREELLTTATDSLVKLVAEQEAAALKRGYWAGYQDANDDNRTDRMVGRDRD